MDHCLLSDLDGRHEGNLSIGNEWAWAPIISTICFEYRFGSIWKEPNQIHVYAPCLFHVSRSEWRGPGGMQEAVFSFLQTLGDPQELHVFSWSQVDGISVSPSSYVRILWWYFWTMLDARSKGLTSAAGWCHFPSFSDGHKHDVALSCF